MDKVASFEALRRKLEKVLTPQELALLEELLVDYKRLIIQEGTRLQEQINELKGDR